MRVEVFTKIGREQLKEVLQEWLDENPDIQIHHVAMTQHGAGSGYILAAVFYTLT